MPVAHDEPEDADGASSNDNAAAVGSGQQFDEEDGQCDHVENDEADEEEQEKAEDEAGEAEEDVARLSDFDEDGDMIEYGAASGQEGQGYGMVCQSLLSIYGSLTDTLIGREGRRGG